MSINNLIRSIRLYRVVDLHNEPVLIHAENDEQAQELALDLKGIDILHMEKMKFTGNTETTTKKGDQL